MRAASIKCAFLPCYLRDRWHREQWLVLTALSARHCSAQGLFEWHNWHTTIENTKQTSTGSRSIDRRLEAFTISFIIVSRVASSPRFRLVSTTLLLHFSLESSSTCDRTQRQNRSDSLGRAFSMRYYDRDEAIARLESDSSRRDRALNRARRLRSWRIDGPRSLPTRFRCISGWWSNRTSLCWSSSEAISRLAPQYNAPRLRLGVAVAVRRSFPSDSI